ncbi:Octaprenyl diphosphate synthase / Dimethylallyltransferase / (2E,6E)-farnesyl diphosphate synthase / Geranylgeranyl pyrophosphate synthetase [Olavius algarvensis spirochete endosymbiont]|nr:Octaprenyl diphosphate synthase / Dimethylallyltransferase / (2E,6E)-farnesyl diphosphate synthase / Geranylgeranyl pyrophosphate synthetase [Olavius algarvensis spirochete endosymbiont]
MISISFNPRTREGCDGRAAGPQTRCYVSIHAPARGATVSASRLRSLALFQSTHPRGVRHRSALVVEGRSTVSIHAPARGATGHGII